jgi:hypothetical protein
MGGNGRYGVGPPSIWTPPSESDSRPAGALVTGIFDPHTRRGAEAWGQPQAGGRSMKGPSVARAVPCHCPGAWHAAVPRSPGRRVSGTGGAGGQSPAGHVRRPSVPAEPPAVGFTCLPPGALLPRCRAVRHSVRLRLHGGVMKRAFEAKEIINAFTDLERQLASPGGDTAIRSRAGRYHSGARTTYQALSANP